MLKKLNKNILLFLFSIFFVFSLQSQTTKTTSSLQDVGKMWTFDNPPFEYFKNTYNFEPTQEWLQKARLSALRTAGCSASFISEDGLVLTNHHCARGALERVAKPGEKLLDTGFIARTFQEERKIPDFYVDQLVLIEDITKDIQDAFNSGKTDDEKIKARQKKMQETEQKYKDKTGLICQVVTFYNGGKYSIYGFKRYTDIRLVFAPETDIGFFGGDPDNFTFPRYDLDMSLLRVYDETGNPLKTKNYFKFNPNGPKEGDLVFVVGNPGRTNRLLTLSQLEFMKNYSNKVSLSLMNNLIKAYNEIINKYPENKYTYQNALFGITNSQKVIDGIIKGLNNEFLMNKKIDFETKLRDKVNSNPGWKNKYANIWDDITKIQNEKAKIFNEYFALNIRDNGLSHAFSLAGDLVDYLTQYKLPENERDRKFKNNPKNVITQRKYPTGIDLEIEESSLKFQLEFLLSVFSKNNKSLNNILENKNITEVAKNLISNSILYSKEKMTELIEKDPENILKSNDPVISFVVNNKQRAKELLDQYSKLQSSENAKVQLLGMALFEIFGTSIAPDGNFNLRLADGVVKSYEYNGTLAPPVTTFYGLYDRYYSYGKQDPWNLPVRWINPPIEFDKSTPLNFVSTADTYGGNSGSPIINKNLEIVGLNFDRNIDGLPRAFIYFDERARNVGVHTSGILEALQDIYKFDRIVKELLTSKISN